MKNNFIQLKPYLVHAIIKLITMPNPTNGKTCHLRVAIMGSGPSGFYAAEELLTQKDLNISVDMYDRLPTPFGLVRGGVAPDHPKIKSVVKIFERTAAREGFRFFGNIEFGRDIQLKQLSELYDAMIFAIGAKSDRKMGIPGEELDGSYPATVFVGWYNGHPDYQKYSFNLKCKNVAVVGNGNVAIDVARILARSPDSLVQTDIADYAMDALKKSTIENIYLLGRRGPVQAAFTTPEIRELCNLEGADLVVDPQEIDLDDLSKESLAAGDGGTKAKNNLQILTEQSQKKPRGKNRKIHIKFLVSPVELQGKNKKVTAIKIEKNKLFKEEDGSLRPKGTKEFEVIPMDLVFRSIGYKGVALPGLPYDEKKGTIPNIEGRAMDQKTQKPLKNIYVVGWAKRGPSGVIGTNKPDSIETVKHLLEDINPENRKDGTKKPPDAVLDLFKKGKSNFISFDDWKKLDNLEIQRGQSVGKSRKKFSNVSNMLKALDTIKGKINIKS